MYSSSLSQQHECRLVGGEKQYVTDRENEHNVLPHGQARMRTLLQMDNIETGVYILFFEENMSIKRRQDNFSCSSTSVVITSTF